MSAPRGHRAETEVNRALLADAPDVHDRPDGEHFPGQPCAAARRWRESLIGTGVGRTA